MTFDPTKPSASEGTFGEALDATRSNLNDVNDRLKAQEDLALASTKNEVVAARGTKSTVKDRLAVALNDDGSLKFDSLKNMTWIASGDVPTYVNAQSFTAPGDQTAKYLSGLVLRLMHGTTQIHSVVSVASYVAGTDKTTVSLQQSLLTPALSSVLIGLASLGEVLYEEALLKAIPTEPAWRSETPPCLFDLAIPGQPLDPPFEFSRPTPAIGFNSLGQYTMVAANVLRDHYDPDTLEYKGKLYIPNTYKSSCQNYNAAPVDIAGVQLIGGGGNALLSVVDDTENLKKVPVLRQLLKEGTLNGKVFKIDNSLGDVYTYARVAGNTGGIGGIGGETVTLSAYARSEGADGKARIEIAGGYGATLVNGEVYKFYERTSDLPDGINGQFVFLVEAHTVGYFILNQCEIASEPCLVPIIHEGASVTTTADVLTIGPAETGGNIVKNGTFDDMEDWVSGTQWVNEEGAIRLNSEEGISLENRSLVQRCLTVGKRYRMHYSVTVGALASGKTRLFISNQADDDLGVVGLNGAAGDHFADFTADGDELRLAYSRNSAGAGGYCKIDNVCVVELVPFEGWDSDADGHAILFDGLCLNTETVDIGPYLLKCREVKYGNIGPWKTPDGREMRVVAFGNDNGASINNTGNTKISLEHVDYTLLNVISFNQNSVAMSWNGETSETDLLGTLHGLDQISFGVGRYIAPQPICIKRFAVYNRYLSTTDKTAMVTK